MFLTKAMQQKKGFWTLGAYVCGLAFLSTMMTNAQVKAQQTAKLTIEVSTDSILLGNYFQVTFTLENANGDNFEPPTFENFTVVSGPNLSSSFSMANGVMKQSIAYSYYLEPKDIGNYYIEPASIEADGMVLMSEPVEVMVVPNPEGIIQNPPSSDKGLKFDFGSPFDSDFFNNNDFFNTDPFHRMEELRQQLYKNMPQFEFNLPLPDTLQQPKTKRKVYRM
jgi:hypothetical protein